MDIQKLAAENGGAVTLNLSHEEEYTYILNQYGGEEVLSGYPDLKQTLNDTKAAHARGEGTDYKTLLSLAGEEQKGLVDAAYIAYAYYSQTKGTLDYACVISLTSPAQVCNVQIDVLDKNQKQIAKKYEAYKNTGYIVVKDSCALSKEKFPGNIFDINVSVSTLGRGKSILDLVVTSRRFCITEQIYKADIAHPMKKFQEGETINVFFGRYPGKYDKKIDYVYEDAYIAEQQCAEMTLDMMGTAVYLNKETGSFHPVESECTAVMDLKRGACLYSTSGGMTLAKEGDTGFGWYFDRQWGVKIPKDSFQASNLSLLTMTLRYKMQEENDETHTLTVTSHLDQDLGASCRQIRSFDLKIGCLAPGTRIRLADGRVAPVETLQIGELVVAGTDNSFARIKNIFRGNENGMIMIETEQNNQLLISSTHLVETDQGLCEAGQMNAGMKVLNENGELVPVRYLYAVEYQGLVYNLELEIPDGAGRISAEGIMVGDVNTRKSGAEGGSRTPLEEEAGIEELYQEFLALDRRL